ncbi:MAG: MBL fold metallo-hydrolase [Gammaproteobacteria bacterium]|nr:MBL fold metallo-hydrolase [Gammaproteobacteria bacterium]
MKPLAKIIILFCFTLFTIYTVTTSAKPATKNQAATTYTKKANKKVATTLPFDNTDDFTSSTKGLVAQPPSLIIHNAKGQTVWDMDAYTRFEGINDPAPKTVNPSLWRQARLNTIYGLYKVSDRIYQVRNYDLAVMSIIVGRKGYIVIDPLTATETAKAAMQLVYKNLGKKPISAVIYTHSHIDHFGGVKGIISEAQVKSGKVQVIAPEGFEEEAISENVMAGTVMARRAVYMYGNLLPKSATGQVGAGLGKTTPSNGTASFIPPSKIISKTPTKMTIDGVKVIFQYTPNAEAPAEMTFYFPQFHALCMAENASHTLHNLYTLRGAKVRDSQSWAGYINQTIQMFGDDVKVEFASHHWPMWGHDKIIDYLGKQRDAYQYIHDQTLRLANEGYMSNDNYNSLLLTP